MTTFDNIALSGWRQFENLEMNLANPVTVITGPNGSGKTSILNLLSRHFGWTFLFVNAPILSKRSKRRIYSDLRYEFFDETPNSASRDIGSIRYADGRTCTLRVANSSAGERQYQPQFDGVQPVEGLHIPSHRAPASFQAVDSIPTNPKSQGQLYSEFQQVLAKSFGPGRTASPSLILKQSLIALAVFGYDSGAVVGNDEYRGLFEGFQDVLRVVLPPELGFERLEVRMPDVVFVTRSGSFSLDAMSGGVSSVFSIAWQIFMYGADKNACTVLIDEPENHLHPQMQRSLLPNLSQAFPSYRFVVATHSPFVITSLESAAVFGLVQTPDLRVYAERLSHADLASRPEKILDEVLGVPTSIPIWVESKIRNVLRRYPNASKQDAEKMLEELRAAGLDDALSGFSETGQ